MVHRQETWISTQHTRPKLGVGLTGFGMVYARLPDGFHAADLVKTYPIGSARLRLQEIRYTILHGFPKLR